MRKFPECNKEISVSATICPHCHAKPPVTGWRLWLVVVFAALVFYGIYVNV